MECRVVNKYFSTAKIWLIVCLFNAIFSVYVSAEITVDGRLDETEWKQAQRFENFVETSPFSLKETTHPTEVLVLTDEKGIYFGFINEQPWDTRYRRKQERDAMWADSDRNFISIDFDGKANMGYFFGVNLGGSMSDGSISGESQMDRDWDGDWEAKTSESETHWYSEFFLPWTVVPMMSGQESKRNIGVYFSRQMMQEGKVVGFPGINYERKKFLSLFHQVTVDQYESTKFVTFPYAVSSYDNLQDSAEYQAGLDLFWALGNGRELNMTVNPDFGQVESDEVIINFSPIETRLSDRRPFFAENQGLFTINSHDYGLINTRRIGSSPDYNCDEFSAANGGSDEEQFNCENQPVLANSVDIALKYYKQGENADIGIFTAFEGDEAYSTGKEFYAVRTLGRLNQHKIGYLGTYVKRDAIDREASTHTIDYENQLTDKLTFEGILMHSNTTEKNGSGMRWGIKHSPNQKWENRIQYKYYDDDFDINDMGYMSRNNIKGFNVFSKFSQTEFSENSNINGRVYYLGLSSKEDADDLKLERSLRTGISQRSKDSSSIELHLNHRSSGRDDLITRGNPEAPFMRVDGSLNYQLSYGSKEYKKWNYFAFMEGQKTKVSSFNSSTKLKALGFNFHPTDEIKISIMAGKGHVKNWVNWIGSNVIGTYPMDYFTIRANASWFPKEKHELRVKFETVVMEAETGLERSLDSHGNVNPTQQSTNGFDVGQLSFQIRYKYELGPLSNVYAVYTRGGRHYENDNASVSEIISGAWDNPKEDRFTLKLRIKF